MRYAPDIKRMSHGKLFFNTNNKLSSVKDSVPDGNNINTEAINKVGLPKLLLLKAGPILCKERPEKSNKKPNQNCMSAQSIHTGLHAMYMLFLY